MAVVGVTGHSNLTDETAVLVRDGIRAALDSCADDLTGVTCLARGADQVFADIVLERGGGLWVVVPAEDYFTGITDPASRKRCDAYLSAAAKTIPMGFAKSGQQAYLAASRYLVDHCDALIAVWDGSPGSGTAAAVAYAEDRERPVTLVWPDGARRRT